MSTQKRKLFTSTWKEYASSAGSVSITWHDGHQRSRAQGRGRRTPSHAPITRTQFCPWFWRRAGYSRDCQRRLGERLRRNKQSLGEIKSQGPSEAGKFSDLQRSLGSMSSMSEITVRPEQACAATGNHHRLPPRGPAGPPRHPDSQDDSPDFASSLQEMCLKHLLKLTRTLQEPETHRRRGASRIDDVKAHVQKRCATQNYKKERW